MSFDLYVFPPPAPTTGDEVHRLMEVKEERLESGGPEPAPGLAMQRFLDELEARWLGLDDDELNASPWAFWPLWQPVGAGTALNIAWPQAKIVRVALVETAGRLGLTLYDPQEDVLVPPEPRRRGVAGCGGTELRRSLRTGTHVLSPARRHSVSPSRPEVLSLRAQGAVTPRDFR